MEIITSYNKSELEQIIYEAIQKAFNKKPSAPVQEQSDEIGFKEFLQLTGYGSQTGYKKIHQGEVPCYKRGKKLVFSRKEILQWLESQTVRRVATIKRIETQLSESARKKRA